MLRASHGTSIVTVCWLSLFAAHARADTLVPGGSLTGTTTWTATGSPYVVTGPVVISAGSTLTIEGGVDVRFSGYMGALNVEGTLVIDGRTSRVTLHGDPAASGGSWGGIVIASGATSAVIEGADITGAGQCIDSSAAGAVLSLVGSTLSGCYGALRISAGNPIVSDVTIDHAHDSVVITATSGTTTLRRVSMHDNLYGVQVEYGGTARVELENFVMWENSYYAVRLNCTWGTPSARIASSTIHRTRGLGVSVVSACGTVDIIDTIFSTSTSSPIYRGSGPPVTISYSTIWGSFLVGEGYTAGPGMVNMDPQFVAPPADLHLSPSSPLIDAGSPTSTVSVDRDGRPRPVDGDRDGTATHDIGAFEPEPPIVCGDGLISLPEVCDDGALNGMYGHCNATCDGLAEHCGDSTVTAVVEECDDGNDSDEDDCLSDCTVASCGDAHVQAGVEECDDGNLSANDACLPDCVAATCGDGFHHWDVEECDDGNREPGDGCSDVCTIEPAPVDAGTPDAGVDAGVGAGADAGADAGVDAAGHDAGSTSPSPDSGARQPDGSIVVPPDMASGCSVGGGAGDGSAMWLLLTAALLTRRRRKHR